MNKLILAAVLVGLTFSGAAMAKKRHARVTTGKAKQTCLAKDAQMSGKAMKACINQEKKAHRG